MARWEDKENEGLPWREKYAPYHTSSGVLVRPLHYRMVPDKDPDRRGRDWHDREIKITPKRVWSREQEIMFGAAEGGLVYKEWSPRIHHLIEGFRLREDWFYFAGIDPGVGVTAALWYAITPEDYHFLIDEYYAGDSVPNSETLSATGHAEAIKNRTQVLCNRIYGLTKGGSPRKIGESWIQSTLIDPSAWRRDNDLSVTAQRYIDAGMNSLIEATRDIPGGIERVKELELRRKGLRHPNDLPDDGRGFPLKYSYPHLVNYVKEKRHYRYKTGTETPEDKRNHLMDVERYLCVHVRERPRVDYSRPMTPLGVELTKLKNPTKGGSVYERLAQRPT